MPSARPASTIAASLLLAACAEGPADNSRCVMHEVADMPVLNGRGRPVVEVGIDGTPVAFLVDTGASMSTVTPEAVDRLGLPVDRDQTAFINGVGGSTLAYTTSVDKLDLGTAVAHRVDLAEAGTFGKVAVDGLPLAGLFGADFLANYEVEFDLPAHHVSLYRAEACNADFAQPWDGLAYRQRFDLERRSAIMLDVRLNGAPIRMQLDSGAGRTTIDLDSAASAGAGLQAMRDDREVTTRGIDENAIKTHLHRFASLQVGPDRISPFWVAAADIQSNSLLGADFLRTHRVWISYDHDLIWVQPVGRLHIAEPASPGAAART